MQSKNNLISFLEVRKDFKLHFWKKKTAVVDITAEIPENSLCGFIGANGSGKSTLFKMLLGLIRPTTGDISVFGHSPESRSCRELIGFLPENARLPKFISAKEALCFYGKLYGFDSKKLKSRTDELLQLVGLTEAEDEKIGGYSKGMSQRVAIAQALLHHPKILILDEPMSGLDPLGRRQFRNLIKQLHEEMKMTVLMSTHSLEDAELLCNYYLLLKKGNLIASGNAREVLSQEHVSGSEQLEELLFGETAKAV